MLNKNKYVSFLSKFFYLDVLFFENLAVLSNRTTLPGGLNAGPTLRSGVGWLQAGFACFPFGSLGGYSHSVRPDSGAEKRYARSPLPSRGIKLAVS